MEHFFNAGYGWVCRRCGATQEDEGGQATRARFFREGEAEEKEPRLSAPALARWKDDNRETLMCPQCGAEEKVA